MQRPVRLTISISSIITVIFEMFGQFLQNNAVKDYRHVYLFVKLEQIIERRLIGLRLQTVLFVRKKTSEGQVSLNSFFRIRLVKISTKFIGKKRSYCEKTKLNFLSEHMITEFCDKFGFIDKNFLFIWKCKIQFLLFQTWIMTELLTSDIKFDIDEKTTSLAAWNKNWRL